jgi:hypothetical protein
MKKILTTIIILAVFGVPIYFIFHEDFSDQPPPENYFADAQRCQHQAEVSGNVWLACKASVAANLDNWPDALPNKFPPYEGVVAVLAYVLDTVDINKKMQPEDIILRVRNPYKEYCVISSWITQNIRQLKPRCPNNTIER